MAVDGLIKKASAFRIRPSVYLTREGIVRPIRAVTKDTGFSTDFRLADPALEARRPDLKDVLGSDSWSDVLTENSHLSDIPKEELLKAISSSVEQQDVGYKMVDNLMATLVNQGHFEFGVELLERCSALGIIKDASLAHFLKLCCEVERVDIMVSVALHWIRSGEREFRGYASNSVTYHAFLAGDVDICLYLLRTMHDHKIPFESDYPYSITIHACNTDKRWDTSLEVYELFKESRLRHSRILIRNILYTVREGNMRWKFEEVVDEWMYKRGLHFEVFRAMMETCKHFGDLDRAKAIFKHIRKERVNLDIRCINTLLSIYKDISAVPPMDDVFSFLERSGIRPDVFTFSLLFGCCFKTYQPISIVDQVLEQVKQWNVKFNPVMLSSACMAYARAESDPTELRVSRAMSLMKSTNVADQDCYHATIAACVEMGHLEEALQLREDMEDAGYPSNETTYNILSQKCLNAGFNDYAVSFKDRWEAYMNRNKEKNIPEEQ